MSRTRRVLALALAAACAGCDDGGADAEKPLAVFAPPMERRADIELQRASREDYAPVLLRTFTPPSELATWRIEGAQAALEAGALKLTPESGTSIRFALPGPHDLRRASALTLRVHAPVELTARFDGESVRASVANESESAGWRVLRAPFPPRLADAPALGDIELELSGAPASGVAVDHIGFEWAPAPNWLPFDDDARNGATPLAIAGDCRPSVALRAGELLRGSGRAPGAGARLVFSYAALDPLRGKPTRVELRGRVRSGGETQEFALEITSTARWREYEREFAIGAGDEVELELELVVSGPGTALAAISGAGLRVPQSSPPTVVLVTSDTHRGDHLGAARSAVELATPALDELAARGVLFEDCFSTSNITIPSHVALLTGEHPLSSGMIGNNMTLGGEPATLAEAFRDAGYTTHAVTSINLLSSAIAGVHRGFDRLSSPATSRSAERSVGIALDWLAEAEGEPVFLWLHVFDAHAPYVPAGAPDEAPRDDVELAGDGNARIPPWAGENCDVPCIRDLYGREISNVDRALSRLFAVPRVGGGVIAFTADHGEVLGLHGIYWAHKALYPDTLHVPLILAWPGAPPAQRVATPVSNFHVARTLLDLAGLAESEFPGANLLVRAASSSAEPRFGLEGRARSASITHEGWHLLLQLEELPDHERHEKRGLHEVQLYELASDPTCQRNLVDEQFERARELRTGLVRWLASWRGERFVGAVRRDAETMRELARLGYAESGPDHGAEPLIDPACACASCVRFR